MSVFDPAQGTREDYLRRSVKFGIRVDRPGLTIAPADVARITPLGQLDLSLPPDPAERRGFR